MKTPKDYLAEMQMDDDILFNRHEVSVWLSDFIKEVQINSYNQAIEDAISAEWRQHNGIEFTDEEMRAKLKIK